MSRLDLRARVVALICCVSGEFWVPVFSGAVIALVFYFSEGWK
jgi:hypothetical protein